MKLNSILIQLAAVFAIGLSSAGATPLTQTYDAGAMPVDICDLCTASSTISVANHGAVIDLNAWLTITHSFDVFIRVREP